MQGTALSVNRNLDVYVHMLVVVVGMIKKKTVGIINVSSPGVLYSPALHSAKSINLTKTFYEVNILTIKNIMNDPGG